MTARDIANRGLNRKFKLIPRGIEGIRPLAAQAGFKLVRFESAPLSEQAALRPDRLPFLALEASRRYGEHSKRAARGTALNDSALPRHRTARLPSAFGRPALVRLECKHGGGVIGASHL